MQGTSVQITFLAYKIVSIRKGFSHILGLAHSLLQPKGF